MDNNTPPFCGVPFWSVGSSAGLLVIGFHLFFFLLLFLQHVGHRMKLEISYIGKQVRKLRLALLDCFKTEVILLCLVLYDLGSL